MSINDAEIYPVNISAAGITDIVPAVAGRRVRLWRAVLTFDYPTAGDLVTFAFSEGAMPQQTTFYAGKGAVALLGAEARSWVTGPVGEPLGLSLPAGLSVKGSLLAEYVV